MPTPPTDPVVKTEHFLIKETANHSKSAACRGCKKLIADVRTKAFNADPTHNFSCFRIIHRGGSQSGQTAGWFCGQVCMDEFIQKT